MTNLSKHKKQIVRVVWTFAANVWRLIERIFKKKKKEKEGYVSRLQGYKIQFCHKLIQQTIFILNVKLLIIQQWDEQISKVKNTDHLVTMKIQDSRLFIVIMQA